MRCPRLETIIGLAIELIFAFACVFAVIYCLGVFVIGHGIDLGDKGLDMVLIYVVSMLGAGSVLVCGTIMVCIEELKKKGD